MQIINAMIREIPECIMAGHTEISIGNCIGPGCIFYGKNRCMCYISGHDLKFSF